MVVSVSIVEGAADEPTAAEAVSTLQSLYASGELQRVLADGCITDELAEAPELHIEAAQGVQALEETGGGNDEAVSGGEIGAGAIAGAAGGAVVGVAILAVIVWKLTKSTATATPTTTSMPVVHNSGLEVQSLGKA